MLKKSEMLQTLKRSQATTRRTRFVKYRKMTKRHIDKTRMHQEKCSAVETDFAHRLNHNDRTTRRPTPPTLLLVCAQVGWSGAPTLRENYRWVGGRSKFGTLFLKWQQGGYVHVSRPPTRPSHDSGHIVVNSTLHVSHNNLKSIPRHSRHVFVFHQGCASPWFFLLNPTFSDGTWLSPQRPCME